MLSLVEKVFVLVWCTSMLSLVERFLFWCCVCCVQVMLSLVEKGFVLVLCVLCTSYVIFS